MARYTLVKATDSVYFIKSGRNKIGSVFQRNSDKRWVGKIGNDHTTGYDPEHAFHEIVRVKNRIDLCGVNDETKAREALEKRNAEIQKRNAQAQNELIDFAHMLRGIPGLENMPVPTRRKRRTRKVLI